MYTGLSIHHFQRGVLYIPVSVKYEDGCKAVYITGYIVSYGVINC